MIRDKKEEKDKIVVLDEGLDLLELSGPEMVCCSIQIFPFRY